MAEVITCSPRSLPRERLVEAADNATAINPLNRPAVERLAEAMPGFIPTPQGIAILTTKFWGPAGVHLTVGFLDNPPAELRAKILLHMNAWSKTANVSFVESNDRPVVRIARLTGDRDGGFWSYLGTDVKLIPAADPTLNLEGFTLNTPDSEFNRVVRHETGHTMGFPHEHMRRQVVSKIDREKAFAYFERTQGWSRADVRAQVLTPLEDASIFGTPFANPRSIMCYQLPGDIMTDGQPVLGGLDIDESDFAFAGQIYPKPN